MPKKIISGGQTGVDRGALDACLLHAFNSGGWCPKDRLAEDGKIDIKYPLTETSDSDSEIRTRRNAKEANGTLIISPGHLFGGTYLTKEIADEMKKSVLVVSPWDGALNDIFTTIHLWIKKQEINVLNIAGPRKSQWLTGYEISFLITEMLIKETQN